MEISKDLILDVCEPYINIQTVRRNAKSSFNLCVFGSFELGDCDNKILFGTEENRYNKVFNSRRIKRFPLLFAEVKTTSHGNHVLVSKPLSSFSNHDLEQIEDCIKYTLESRRTMSHYALSRC